MGSACGELVNRGTGRRALRGKLLRCRLRGGRDRVALRRASLRAGAGDARCGPTVRWRSRRCVRCVRRATTWSRSVASTNSSSASGTGCGGATAICAGNADSRGDGSGRSEASSATKRVRAGVSPALAFDVPTQHFSKFRFVVSNQLITNLNWSD